MRYPQRLPLGAALLIALTACGNDGSPPTATVAGTVRNATSQEPLEGASVSIGGAQAVTDVNGRYELAGIATGPARLLAQAVGFTPYSETTVLDEGDNTRDILLARQALFAGQGYAVYIDPTVSAVRAVVIVLSGPDTRGIATGAYRDLSPWFESFLRQLRQHLVSRAAEHGLAIMGSEFLLDDVASDTRLLTALQAVAGASGRPELDRAPLFMWGVSGGGPESFGLARRHADRVVGWTAMLEAYGWRPSGSLADRQVPGYVVLGELDRVEGNDTWVRVFEQNRAAGALWALAVEPGIAHEVSDQARSIMVGWADAILELRLPAAAAAGSPVPLRSVEESTGWLGNRTTRAIAAYADYTDDRSQASWLPSEAAARSWQTLVTPHTGAVRARASPR